MKLFNKILALLFVCLPVTAEDGFYAGFNGSRVTGLTRSSTIFESDSTVDVSSGNLIDKSGSNYLTYTDAFGSWTATRSSILADQYRNPRTNALDADVLREDGTAGNSHFVYNSYSTTSGVTYSYSVYVRSLYRTWVRLNVNTDGASAYFQLIGAGAAGTTASGVTTKIHRVSDNWYRCAIKWKSATTAAQQFEIYAAEADNDVTFDGTLDRADLVLSGAQLSIMDSYRTDFPGVYHPVVATVTKPLLDLAPTNSPTESKSYLQTNDGRRLRTRTFNGAGQLYSSAANTALNVSDNNCTITIIAASSAAQTIVGFNNNNTAGVLVRSANIVRWYKADTTYVDLNGPSDYSTDGRYHVFQVVRNNNIARLIVDGISGTPKSVDGYGVDHVSGMSASVGSISFVGSVLYTRIDAEALSDIQLAKEREIIQGTLFGSPLIAGSTFSRAAVTTSVSQTFSDGTIGYVGTNVPRVSGDGGGVLVEEQRENKALQSQTFGTTWGKRAGDSISVDSATILAPDGTATADGIVAENVSEDHYLYQSITMTAAAWSTSVWARPGNKNWIRLANTTVGTSAYFDVANCTVGTTAGILYARTEKFADGWCRCQVAYTATAASTATSIVSAEADGDIIFAGDGATVNTWFWGAQVELGSHPTSYIPTVAASVIRYADNLTIEPWKITKPAAGPRPMMAARFESDVYATGTYTSEIGGYAFTVNGDTKHVESQTLGDYFSFDGTGDYLNVASSDFNPSGDFSVVAIVTPATISGVHGIASKYDSVSNQRGWSFYWNNADVSFRRSTDGLAGTVLTATKASGFVVNKTSLITATYSTVNGLNVYVDDLTVATQAATGTVFPSTTNMRIGADDTTGNANGKIHYVAYYNGVALSATDHTNLYAAFKQANLLPVKIGNSYENKKLYVEFDAKCEYTGSSDYTTGARLFSISGNTGTADSDTNSVMVYGNGTSIRASTYPDAENTERFMSSVVTTRNQWHHYKFYFDFTELSNSQGYIDGTVFTNDATLTGAKNFDLTNTLIRVGQNYAGTTSGNCWTKNLRVRAMP